MRISKSNDYYIISYHLHTYWRLYMYISVTRFEQSRFSEKKSFFKYMKTIRASFLRKVVSKRNSASLTYCPDGFSEPHKSVNLHTQIAIPHYNNNIFYSNQFSKGPTRCTKFKTAANSTNNTMVHRIGNGFFTTKKKFFSLFNQIWWGTTLYVALRSQNRSRFH